MLKGQNIHLRCVTEADLLDLHAYFSSIRMKGEYLSSELISQHQFRQQFLETGFWTDSKGMLLVIFQEKTVGAIWFEKQNFFDCLDLHFYIFEKENRGKGLMQEALHIFSRYLFATKKVQRLQISIPDYSKAALRLAQKCRFQFEGIARSAFFHRGDYLDLCIYSLLRAECKEIEKIYR